MRNIPLLHVYLRKVSRLFAKVSRLIAKVSRLIAKVTRFFVYLRKFRVITRKIDYFSLDVFYRIINKKITKASPKTYIMLHFITPSSDVLKILYFRNYIGDPSFFAFIILLNEQ